MCGTYGTSSNALVGIVLHDPAKTPMPIYDSSDVQIERACLVRNIYSG